MVHCGRHYCDPLLRQPKNISCELTDNRNNTNLVLLLLDLEDIHFIVRFEILTVTELSLLFPPQEPPVKRSPSTGNGWNTTCCRLSPSLRMRTTSPPSSKAKCRYLLQAEVIKVQFDV